MHLSSRSSDYHSTALQTGICSREGDKAASTNQRDGFATLRRKIRFWLRQDPGRWGPGQKEGKGKQKRLSADGASGRPLGTLGTLARIEW